MHLHIRGGGGGGGGDGGQEAGGWLLAPDLLDLLAKVTLDWAPPGVPSTLATKYLRSLPSLHVPIQVQGVGEAGGGKAVKRADNAVQGVGEAVQGVGETIQRVGAEFLKVATHLRKIFHNLRKILAVERKTVKITFFNLILTH